MRELVRNNTKFFAGAALAALALRLVFVFFFPAVVDDSRLYANVAQNWLQHGVYGVTDSGQVVPTLSRLPGYPAFLAAIFSVFGIDNFRAVLLVQVPFDLATCFLIADLSRRLLSKRAAKAAFVLAGLCPFLANYAAAALTETLEIFFTALALDLVLAALEGGARNQPLEQGRSGLRPMLWIGCGLSIGAAILLRPDGGILLAAVGIFLLGMILLCMIGKGGFRSPQVPRTDLNEATANAFIRNPRSLLYAGILLALSALAPLVPWTLRNFHTFHRFQPLAPRYANDSDELVMTGFNRWVKTWMADYVSVQEVYWNVPGEEIDVTRLPYRAFDSWQQRAETESLIAAYNRDHDISPELDARLGALAATRIHAAPLRYYVWLPATRIADMWLRPRTELLPSDPRWWEFNDDGRWLAVSLAFGALNLIYIGMAAAGLLRSHETSGVFVFVLFLLLRSLFLGTLENPEPRYTLECFPVIIVFASALFHARRYATDHHHT